MKIKKTISDVVIAANISNSRKSTGPDDCNAIKQNARKHGLLSRHLKFGTAEEQAEFDQLLQTMEAENQPVGVVEQALVEEQAMSLWKWGIFDGLVMQDLGNQRDAAKAIVRALADNCDDEKQLPLLTQQDGSRSAAQLGWGCQALLIRNGTSNAEQENTSSNPDKKSTTGHVLIEARLESSIDILLRYHTTLKNNFFRANAALRDLQRQRRAKKGSTVSVHGSQ